MENPHAICIKCDGAMDYDSKQTGGNGYFIEFPDVFNLEPITKSIRNDGQGIHRLEMISILEAMKDLMYFASKSGTDLRKATSVIIYSDRYNVTDDGDINPYKVREYIRARWLTKDGKEVKNKDLIDDIDKTRKKLSAVVGGYVSINYLPRKYNKVADKLSKLGKSAETINKRTYNKSSKRVFKRKFDGKEIDYSKLNTGDELFVHIYGWEPIKDNFEISTEIADGIFTGEKLKIYVSPAFKNEIHRGHFYFIEVDNVTKYHIGISSFREREA